ncbi:hypothetical protein DUNSADRAFT_3094 [Dunaliella salina]|uniref:Uncharacterized protein n=1 Tax=Dunaliella salina TaxID=3046 RepID=A0ABQ7GUL0_DUNSA|nr:hypothetical protein DUNSADRAFT_3094 [Dunaliella salina]|eukprot:KAF5838298.1 hypothetical protein DUNSADRAFT_3094 [Dunaliella salina]
MSAAGKGNHAGGAQQVKIKLITPMNLLSQPPTNQKNNQQYQQLAKATMLGGRSRSASPGDGGMSLHPSNVGRGSGAGTGRGTGTSRLAKSDAALPPQKGSAPTSLPESGRAEGTKAEGTAQQHPDQQNHSVLAFHAHTDAPTVFNPRHSMFATATPAAAPVAPAAAPGAAATPAAPVAPAAAHGVTAAPAAPAAAAGGCVKDTDAATGAMGASPSASVKTANGASVPLLKLPGPSVEELSPVLSARIQGAASPQSTTVQAAAAASGAAAPPPLPAPAAPVHLPLPSLAQPQCAASAPPPPALPAAPPSQAAAGPPLPPSQPLQPPTQPLAQPPTKLHTQAPAQPPTQPLTQLSTQPLLQPPTQPLPQPSTQPPTRPPTQPHTQPPTQPHTQRPTQPLPLPPTQSPTQPHTQLPHAQLPGGAPTAASMPLQPPARVSQLGQVHGGSPAASSSPLLPSTPTSQLRHSHAPATHPRSASTVPPAMPSKTSSVLGSLHASQQTSTTQSPDHMKKGAAGEPTDWLVRTGLEPQVQTWIRQYQKRQEVAHKQQLLEQEQQLRGGQHKEGRSHAPLQLPLLAPMSGDIGAEAPAAAVDTSHLSLQDPFGSNPGHHTGVVGERGKQGASAYHQPFPRPIQELEKSLQQQWQEHKLKQYQLHNQLKFEQEQQHHHHHHHHHKSRHWSTHAAHGPWLDGAQTAPLAHNKAHATSTARGWTQKPEPRVQHSAPELPFRPAALQEPLIEDPHHLKHRHRKHRHHRSDASSQQHQQQPPPDAPEVQNLSLNWLRGDRVPKQKLKGDLPQEAKHLGKGAAKAWRAHMLQLMQVAEGI